MIFRFCLTPILLLMFFSACQASARFLHDFPLFLPPSRICLMWIPGCGTMNSPPAE